LILEPDIILADEPVSMLDVSTQASVLSMIKNLVDQMGVGLIYISHDLSTVSYVTEQINVMYLGRFVEKAPTEDLLADPKHPYSQALIDAIPIPDPTVNRTRTEMSGAPRDPVGLGEGCRFRDRCPESMEVCEITPETREVEENHYTACHLHYDHGVDNEEPVAASNSSEQSANSDAD
jgi:peptide/nickel transport system ATP-binding protein